jgi:hypothetical protein
LEDDGFLVKRVAAHEQPQAAIKSEHYVKRGSDDEDLFEFPSDKKARLKTDRPTDEEEDDIFAFVDEVKPKSLEVDIQEDQSAESSELAKKRKLTSEVMSKLSPVSKRHALDKDVFKSHIAESCKNESKECNVALNTFLSAVQEPKVSVFIMPLRLVISTYMV